MLKKVFIILLVVALVLGGAGLLLLKLRISPYVQQVVAEQVAERITNDPEESALLQSALGFETPQTYLVLFLNNTEIRPGGGFIGAYSVVRFDRAVPEILKVEGTEILDNLAPQNFPSVPPQPMKDYLKVERWNFRDSNWSPDFALSSQKSLELYVKERGLAANEIKGIIGFTPTVVEEILKITGPITVDGHVFDSRNFTEKLEYEVEYGYAQKGTDFDERKKILSDLGPVLIDRLKHTAVTHFGDYTQLVKKMIAEKQIMAYAPDPEVQAALRQHGLTGEMKSGEGDYLLWADANLASLKTDASMKRSLLYTLAATNTARVVGTAAMTYEHLSSVNWRTSRYQTYARVFVPSGSKLLDVTTVSSRGVVTTGVRSDSGVENGRQWFGAPILVEPKSTAKLVFRYVLPPEIGRQIAAGTYTLNIQKQLGTLEPGLTVEAAFGKNLQAATPGENPAKYGDARYEYRGDLSVDRDFSVILAP